MNRIPFRELTEAVRSELIRLGYKEQRIRHYEVVWEVLRIYMEKKSVLFFDMKLGLDFLEDVYRITVFRHLSSHKNTIVRAVNMLGELQLHGIVLSKRRTPPEAYHPPFADAFREFIESRRKYGISEKTLVSNELYLRRFSEWLAARDVGGISDLSPEHVAGFATTLAGSSNATIHMALCSLRVLLRHLYECGHLRRDLSCIVPKHRIDKTARIPSAYRQEEVHRLLEAVDRGNPKGKRDYAMMLLASALGMRAGDICALTFGNILWERDVIVLVQQKNDAKQTLPLLPQVGEAIIEYLKYGRPTMESDFVFLRHTCPTTPLTPPTLHSIVSHYIQQAGIVVPQGKKRGPHALRHSLATALLEENVPLPTISEVLGHASVKSTSVYLKIDVPRLRRCALEVEEFAWNRTRGCEDDEKCVFEM